MNLWIIRHAESANNHLAETADYNVYVSTRVSDPPITERGERQVACLAEHIAGSDFLEFTRGGVHARGYGLTRLICSPMLRTLQTAAPVAAALGLPLEVWTEIHEHGGIFVGDPRREPGTEGSVCGHPGLSRAEMERRFPGVIVPEAVTATGWWYGGYEEEPVCAERASLVAARLAAMAAQEPETRLALVTHGTFMNHLLRALMGVAEEAPMYFSHMNTGITRVEFADQFRVLRYLNRIQHLRPELISR